jgi:hypothetical protein
MPASTSLGITYPCSGETIDSGVFQAYVETTQNAISAVQTVADDALYPPAVQARRINNQQNINAGVSTQITWDVEPYDTDAMFVLGTGTITIQTAGTYLVCVQAKNSNQPADFTSIRVAILINAVEVAAAKSDAGNVVNTVSDRVGTSVLGTALAVGTTITANFLYTGAASPMGVDGTLSVIRVATV